MTKIRDICVHFKKLLIQMLQKRAINEEDGTRNHLEDVITEFYDNDIVQRLTCLEEELEEDFDSAVEKFSKEGMFLRKSYFTIGGLYFCEMIS